MTATNSSSRDAEERCLPGVVRPIVQFKNELWTERRTHKVLLFPCSITMCSIARYSVVQKEALKRYAGVENQISPRTSEQHTLWTKKLRSDTSSGTMGSEMRMKKKCRSWKKNMINDVWNPSPDEWSIPCSRGCMLFSSSFVDVHVFVLLEIPILSCYVIHSNHDAGILFFSSSTVMCVR